MEQMNVDESMKVDIDFSNPELPPSVKKLEPLVFKEGGMYCCLLGPDPQEGVFGCGETPKLALADWDEHLAIHLATTTEENEVTAYVKDVLKADDTEVW
jgi:hypothetical protein